MTTGEREQVLRAQLILSVITLAAALAGLLLIQESFMVGPVTVAAGLTFYRFGRLDEHRDSIKINTIDQDQL